MTFKVVVPARYASSRLPGKPLADINGAPMVVHTCRRAASSGAQEVVVATDDERIAVAVEEHGFSAQMTDPDLPSGTDRICAVADARGWKDDVAVVNVQGDEPGIPPAVIDQVAAELERVQAADATTLAEPLLRASLLAQPSVVKVVTALDGRALYFSRAPVPWDRDTFPVDPLDDDAPLPDTGWRRHIGIYAYRVRTLRRFVTLPEARLESIERLEQLRLLANGMGLWVADACAPVPAGVDTQADLDRVRRELRA